MKALTVAATLLLLAGSVHLAAAQGPTAVRWPAATSSSYRNERAGLSAAAFADSTAIPSTKWVQGGVIGALALGGSAAFLISSPCDHDSGSTTSCGSATVGAAAVGASAGFSIGALLGGAIHSGP